MLAAVDASTSSAGAGVAAVLDGAKACTAASCFFNAVDVRPLLAPVFVFITIKNVIIMIMN